MDDRKIRRDILDELESDPSLDAAQIGVAVEHGIATLSGHVESYAQKLMSESIAQRVRGVRAVASEIEIRWPGHKRHEDDEIAARALDIISWDTALPDAAVDIKVHKGWITLSGEVPWLFQRQAAEDAVKKLGGVVGVVNVLEVKPKANVVDVKHRIEAALQRHALIEAAAVKVNVAHDKVTLEGDVHAWSERQAAEQAAWSVPGVNVVENHIRVS